jgi:hypothetical protein
MAGYALSGTPSFLAWNLGAVCRTSAWLHERKKEVVIYDYADLEVPMLAKMFERRRRGYRDIGYQITE